MSEELYNKVLNCISVQTRPISLNMIARKLLLDRSVLEEITNKLREDGKILFTNNKFILFPKDNYIGTVCVSNSGNKFIFNGNEERIPINVDYVDSVILDDMVSYSINSRNEAIVTSIIKRDIDTMTCEVKLVNGKKKLVPFRKDINPIIDRKKMKELVVGDVIKVSNTIPDDFGYANCVFAERLGHINDPTIMQKIILENNGIPTGYSSEYMKELEDIPGEIRIEDYPDRIDYTDIPFTTIDCDSTKDIDDGLYAKRNSDGTIHVKTFLIPIPSLVLYDGAIFKRAFDKQFTTYFRDSCDPLYHPLISNGIGSLNEGELRLTTTVSFDIDIDGNILNPNVERSLGISKMKMTYSDVDKVLNGEIPKGYEEYEETLKLLYEAAMRFKKGSDKRGRIDLISSDVIESKGTDKNELYTRQERTPASELVEFLMIPTNIAIITYFRELGIYLLPYRNHASINVKTLNFSIAKYNDNVKKINAEIKRLKNNNWKKKLNDGTMINVPEREYEEYLPYISYGKNAKNEIRVNLAKLDEPLKTIFDNFVKGSLPRAYYSSICIGHGALGEDYYAHITADIRRFIDGIYHDLLDKISINPDWIEENYEEFYKFLEDTCEKATIMERRTDNASIDELKYNLLTSLEDSIGEEFQATIVGMGKNIIKIKFNEIDQYIDCSSLDENFSFDNTRKMFFDINNGRYLKEGEKIIFTLNGINFSNLTCDITVHGVSSLKKLIKKSTN